MDQRVFVELGIYRTDVGESYACIYYPEDKIAQALSPSPAEIVKSDIIKYQVKAGSKEEARNKLSEAMGPGTFC